MKTEKLKKKIQQQGTRKRKKRGTNGRKMSFIGFSRKEKRNYTLEKNFLIIDNYFSNLKVMLHMNQSKSEVTTRMT
jgi:hypothetical protein